MLITKKTKTLFRFFTLFEYEEEEAFLENQHKNSWKVTGYKLPGFYKFEKCDKEEITNTSAPLMTIFLCAVLPNVVKGICGEFGNTIGDSIITFFFGLMFILYLYVL